MVLARPEVLEAPAATVSPTAERGGSGGNGGTAAADPPADREALADKEDQRRQRRQRRLRHRRRRGTGHRRALTSLVNAVDRTGLTPAIDTRYPMAELHASLDHLDRGAFGKVVIECG